MVQVALMSKARTAGVGEARSRPDSGGECNAGNLENRLPGILHGDALRRRGAAICWLPKVSACGTRLTVGESPTPLNATVCGLPVALSAKLINPRGFPPRSGVKVTAGVVHSQSWRKRPFAVLVVKNLEVRSVRPRGMTLVNVIATVQVFITVMVCGAEVTFCSWLPKLMLVGEKAQCGLRDTTWDASTRNRETQRQRESRTNFHSKLQEIKRQR